MFRPWEVVEKQKQEILSDEKEPVNNQSVSEIIKNPPKNRNTQNNRSTSYNTLNLKSVHSYLLHKIYPSNIKTTNEKSNF